MLKSLLGSQNVHALCALFFLLPLPLKMCVLTTALIHVWIQTLSLLTGKWICSQGDPAGLGAQQSGMGFLVCWYETLSL